MEGRASAASALMVFLVLVKKALIAEDRAIPVRVLTMFKVRGSSASIVGVHVSHVLAGTVLKVRVRKASIAEHLRIVDLVIARTGFEVMVRKASIVEGHVILVQHNAITLFKILVRKASIVEGRVDLVIQCAYLRRVRIPRLAPGRCAVIVEGAPMRL